MGIVDRVVKVLNRVGWIGPLVARVVLGIEFMSTGWGKVHHLDGITQYFASLHIPAAHANAVFVSFVELVGGAALLLGIGTRLAALLLVGTMTVAILTAKLPDLHGIRDLVATVECAYLAMLVWLVFNGAGSASIDRALAGRSRG